jgi:hypothetical protein
MTGKKTWSGILIGFLCPAGAYALPTNADFSSGLTGWTASGNVSDGGGFALFAEAGTPASSSLYQDFVLDPGTVTLSFEYRFVTEGQFNHLALPDAFTAGLLDPVTLLPLLSSPSRDDYFYLDARGETDSLVYEPGLVTRTPVIDPTRPDWFLVTLDVRRLTPGTSVRLQFDLFGGANGQTTFAALDDVGIGGSAPPGVIPEPLSAVLGALALIGLGRYGCASSRRRSASSVRHC